MGTWTTQRCAGNGDDVGAWHSNPVCEITPWIVGSQSMRRLSVARMTLLTLGMFAGITGPSVLIYIFHSFDISKSRCFQVSPFVCVFRPSFPLVTIFFPQSPTAPAPQKRLSIYS